MENICDHKNCKKIGEYKAPKSRSNLKNYYYFCLNHVKEYNKSWDFYKGLSVDEIELSLRKDIVWDRPSWPLNGPPNNILEQISVDIILPNYNSSSYIEETLVSVINQRFKNWKLFIIDDASTDQSFKKIQIYKTHSKIKFFKTLLDK